MLRNSPSFRSQTLVDMPLLLVVVAIASIGVINLYSATSAYVGAARASGLADIYVTQIYWLVVGFLVAMALAAIDYRYLERIAPTLYVGGIFMLCLVFLSADVRGVHRWIRLGGLTFQPSEFMKPLVVLMIARHVHNDFKTDSRTLIDLLKPLAIALLPMLLVILQPDLGTSLIYMLATITMLLITRIRGRSLLTGLFGGLSAVYLMYQFGLKEDQKGRVTSFLDPEADASGTGWHAIQSQTAIGNGGVLGEGFMQGSQNQFGFLPDQHSDFPFSVFAEEFGFLGCMVLLSLYCFLAIWSVHIASLAKDRFGAAIAIGSGSIIFWHAIFNLGMSMGILPVVGITLPLFSYGGSSVVTMLVSLGMLMSVSMRR